MIIKLVLFITLYLILAIECGNSTVNPQSRPITQNDILGKWVNVTEIDTNRCVIDGVVVSSYKERDSVRYKGFVKITPDSIYVYRWDTQSISTGPSYDHREAPYYLSNDSILGDTEWNGEWSDSRYQDYVIHSTTLKFENNQLVMTAHAESQHGDTKECDEREILYLARYYDTIPPPQWPQIPYP